MRPYKTSIFPTHNPKVTGSSPVPATRKAEANASAFFIPSSKY